MKNKVDRTPGYIKIADMSDEDIKAFVGKRIAEARAELGLGQEQFAKALGVTMSAVGQWERGLNSPKLPRLANIAELTGKPAYWFLSGRILSQSGETLTQEEEVLVKTFRKLSRDDKSKVTTIALAAMYQRESYDESSKEGGRGNDT